MSTEIDELKQARYRSDKTISGHNAFLRPPTGETNSVDTRGFYFVLKEPHPFLAGHLRVLMKHVGESPTAHRLAVCVDKHLWRRDRSAYSQPCTKRRCGCLPKRQRSFTAPFAMNTDAHRIQGHTFHAQSDQLRYPETC